MAQFAVIDRAKAPAPPARPSGTSQKRMRQYETYILGIKKGQAGRLVPTEPETSRGVVHRVTRAATRLGVSVETWVVDGAVYFAPR